LKDEVSELLISRSLASTTLDDVANNVAMLSQLFFFREGRG
jgi:hypothetical protein